MIYYGFFEFFSRACVRDTPTAAPAAAETHAQAVILQKTRSPKHTSAQREQEKQRLVQSILPYISIYIHI